MVENQNSHVFEYLTSIFRNEPLKKKKNDKRKAFWIVSDEPVVEVTFIKWTEIILN